MFISFLNLCKMSSFKEQTSVMTRDSLLHKDLVSPLHFLVLEKIKGRRRRGQQRIRRLEGHEFERLQELMMDREAWC